MAKRIIRHSYCVSVPAVASIIDDIVATDRYDAAKIARHVPGLENEYEFVVKTINEVVDGKAGYLVNLASHTMERLTA